MDLSDIRIKSQCNVQDEVLSIDALSFLKTLHKRFERQRSELLSLRHLRKLDTQHSLPDFLPETAYIRDTCWSAANIPEALNNRVVEITGPVDAKIIINAMNSNANVFLADFEDSTSPTWNNCINGQLNLIKAVSGSLQLSSDNKNYSLNSESNVILMVRPRGLHMEEAHLNIANKNISASIFDIGLFLFHNARELLKKQKPIALYIPKIEHYLEANWWNSLLSVIESELGLVDGTIKVTVLCETLPIVFQLDEVAYYLRDRLVGINFGRYDYIFSFIKTLGKNPNFIFPNKNYLTMDQEFLGSAALSIVKTCLKRGIKPIGGMSAFLPVKDNSYINSRALDSVELDKQREVYQGFKGAWVAHPGLIDTVRGVFINYKPEFNIDWMAVELKADSILSIPKAKITYADVISNVTVCINYLYKWFSGIGAIAIDNKMEDMATFEINRMLLASWIYHNVLIEEEELDLNTVLIVVDEVATKLIDSGFDEVTMSKAHESLNLLISSMDIDFAYDICYKEI